MSRRRALWTWCLFAASPLAAQNTYSFIPNLVYGVAPDQQGNPVTLRLDLYLPAGASGPTPCVVWIHGGAWQGGSRFPTPASDFANHGYAVASISYRLSSQNLWPAQLHDCRGAVRWLRANAATYNLDPDRFGAFGSSAGGHLSNMLGVTSGLEQARVGQLTLDLEGVVGGNLGESSEVQAVVDWFGPTDVLRMSQFPSNIDHDAATSPESRVLGQPQQSNPEAAGSLSPITYLWRGAPPTFVVHGTSDSVIPYEQSQHFWRRATQVYGLDYDFEAIPSAGHGGPGFDVDDARAWFDARLADRATRISIQVSGAVSEPAGVGAFTISRVGPTTAAQDVFLAWRGDAAVGEDVACLPALVTIPAGSASVVLPVSVLDDALVEPAEALRARVLAGADYVVVAGAGEAALTVQDDDAPSGAVTVSVVAVDRTMAEPGPNPAVVRVARTGPTTQALSVELLLRGGAEPGVDHGLTAGPVVIPAGAASVDVTIPVVDDAISEPTELWVVELRPRDSYALGAQRVASGRLFDDDRTAGPVVSIAAERQRLDELGGVVDLLVTRTQSAGALTVSLGAGGTATAGVDYSLSTSSVTFAPNQSEVRVTLTGVDDGLAEGDEELIVAAVPAAGASYRVGVQSSQSLRVVDDEAVVPLQAPAILSGGEVAIGRPACLTLAAPAGSIHVTGLAFAPGYVATSPYPLLIDGAGAATFGLGVVPATGAAAFALDVPEAAMLIGTEVWMQSAVVGANVVFSSRLQRRLVMPASK